MKSAAHVPAADAPPRNVIRQRAVRYWRLVTLVYVIALTLGTHWPELQVSVGDGPPPDKVLHLFAFGGLTLLLWQCRFVSRVLLVGLIAAVWVLLDEWTQSLPSLNRQSSWTDVVAGLAGVVCAVLWLWATMPIGGQLSRWRRALFDQIVDTRLSRLNGWLHLGCIATLDAIMAAVLSIMLIAPTQKEPQVTILIAFCLGFIFGVHDAFSKWWRQDAIRMREAKRCFVCCASCATVTYEQSGYGICSNCSATVHEAQWSATASLSRRRVWWLRFSSVCFFLMFVVCLKLLLVIAELLAGSRLGDPLITVISEHRLETIVQLTLVCLPFAAAVRAHRELLRSGFDLQGNVCVQCGYVLKGLPVTGSVGRCPECAAEFVRLDTSQHGNDDT